MTMTNIFVATVRVKRVACGRVGFEGCRVLPAIYAVHSSRLSHPLFGNLLLEAKTPVLTRRRSHAFSGMTYPLRHVYLEPVDRDLKVSFICAACAMIGSYASVMCRGELQEDVEANTHLFLGSALDDDIWSLPCSVFCTIRILISISWEAE